MNIPVERLRRWRIALESACYVEDETGDMLVDGAAVDRVAREIEVAEQGAHREEVGLAVVPALDLRL